MEETTVLSKAIRRESIENSIRSSSLLYAYAQTQYGEPLPKIRFVHDIPFLLQVNFTQRRRYGWNTHSLLDVFGIDFIAELDELRELMKDSEPWDHVMISFPLEQNTQSLHETVVTYHKAKITAEQGESAIER